MYEHFLLLSQIFVVDFISIVATANVCCSYAICKQQYSVVWSSVFKMNSHLDNTDLLLSYLGK